MASCARCSLCGINYPAGKSVCEVKDCGERLSPLQYAEPDNDWRERVNEMSSVVGAEYVPTSDRTYDPANDAKIIAWRASCFEKLGMTTLHADALAVRRDVDRCEVERLVRAGCPPQQVGTILL